MLALVKTAEGPGLELRDWPEPAVGINDVLIRVHRTGICGTDLHIESWDAWAAKNIKPPLVIGHEFVGEVVAVGSNVADFAPGDLVLTGTPSGVGVFRDPPVFLVPGDVVRVEVEGIGSVTNPIVDEDSTAPPGSPAARLLSGRAATAGGG